MSKDQSGTGPIDVIGFKAANARAYLNAVFAAWSEGHVTTALPDRVGSDIPGVRLIRQQAFDPDPGWFEADMPARPSQDRALIAFSSGTTGIPKAILLSHGALGDVVGRINAAMDTDETIREYLGVPVTFSFGFGRARAVAEAGGAAYLPQNGFDPAEIGRMLATGDINAVSAVPTLWRVLLANADVIPVDAARRLRWIEIGSQLMTGAEKLALRQLFPEARIVQHYGLTEASRSALLDISNAPEHRLDSVGRETGAVRFAIDANDQIRVTGPHLAEGLVTADGVTPLAEADGWLTTSDRGRIEDGWLYYGGRVDELVNVGGVKIDPTAFEQSLNRRIGTPGAVAAGRMADALRGEKLLIARPESTDVDHATLTEAATELVADYGITGTGAFEIRDVEEIPLTATGKVRRADLADLPAVTPDAKADGEKNATAQANDASGKVAELQTLWGEILGAASVSIDKSFYDLGGDSLSALTAALQMEKRGIDMETARGIFDGKTIRDLVGDAGATPAPEMVSPDTGSDQNAKTGTRLTLAQAINAVHATRGILVLWVITIHWLPGVLLRLNEQSIAFYHAMVPAWRFGTPGFALVFGIGVGALRLHHYQSNKALFMKNIRLNALLVVGGVVLLGLLNLANIRFGDTPATVLSYSGAFYSVITYYALVLIFLPQLLWLISRGRNRLATVLGLAVVSMAIHEVLWVTFGPMVMDSAVLEWLKLITTAKYGFFRMTGYVLIGVAIGWLYRAYHDRAGLSGQTASIGAVMIGFGALALYQHGPEDIAQGFNLPSLWHLSIYAGVAILVLAGFSWINGRDPNAMGGAARRINAFFIATGILALPLFVGHELVIPIKRLLDSFGVPELISLGLPVVLFLLGVGFAYLRLIRLFVR